MNRTGEAPALQDERIWICASYVYGILVAVVLGYFLLRIPIQVFDCFTDMLALQQSMGYLIQDAFRLPAYLRPGRWVFQKLVFDLADGHYFYAFRLTQVIQVLLLVMLFIRLVEPRTRAAAAVVPLGLAVLTASHTFAWTVREAFPINHFLTILVCCAAAANVAFARHRWWTDVLAAALFIAAAGTLESGLLVWVIFVGGYLIGLRGVSRAGIFGVTALVAAYFYVRFVLFDVGVPGLQLRDAGFGFNRYDAAELDQMFRGNPFVFYAYNVMSSIVGVLFAEPRDGVWRVTHGLIQRRVDPALVVNVATSTLATVMLGQFAWRRRHSWTARAFDRRDQIVVLFLVVLVANAAISYPYTKDVIMSPAGAFFAAAVFVACVDAIEASSGPNRLSTAWTLALVAVLSAGWAIRVVGIHAALVRTSYQVRQQWAYVDEWIPRWRDHLAPRELALKQQLQNEAVLHHPAKPLLREEWTRLFDTD